MKKLIRRGGWLTLLAVFTAVSVLSGCISSDNSTVEGTGTPDVTQCGSIPGVADHKYLHNFLGLFDNLGMSLKNTLATLMNVYLPVTVVWSWNT